MFFKLSKEWVSAQSSCLLYLRSFSMKYQSTWPLEYLPLFSSLSSLHLSLSISQSLSLSLKHIHKPTDTYTPTHTHTFIHALTNTHIFLKTIQNFNVFIWIVHVLCQQPFSSCCKHSVKQFLICKNYNKIWRKSFVPRTNC